MSIDIRLPKITSTNPTAQVAEISSYLYQMVEQLNWALNTLDSGSSSNASIVLSEGGSGEITPEEANNNTFNSIKALIIKSADIIEAYSEQITKELNSTYLAISDYGTYESKIKQMITDNASGITRAFKDIQAISNTDGTGSLDELIKTKAYIKTGLLYEDDQGVHIYGVEVGQTDEIDGQEVFNKFARFVSDRLSFYDSNGSEVAYISDYMLYISNATILGNLQIGKYVMDTSNGIIFRWVGE